MSLRYRTGLVLTSLLLLGAASGTAKTPDHRLSQIQDTLQLRAADIYSRRALRRARIILQLKLLELRSERLERVRKAIERHIPVDEIFKDI